MTGDFECPNWKRAEARLEAGIKDMIERAVGGAYEMPDGRKFWIDAPIAREIVRRAWNALNPGAQP